MTQRVTAPILLILAAVTVAGCTADTATDQPALGAEDLTGLKACEGVVELFRQYPDSVWPGFNLARKPFMFYMPGEWVLLFNYSGEVDGFTEYPAGWPHFNAEVLYHQGQYRDLAGQLSFGVPAGSLTVVAVPFIDRPAADIFAYIVHENFHQYQTYDDEPAFGEIPWEREERYPIEDTANTALAYLEMRLLMDALAAAETEDEDKCIEKTEQFVAVRDYRWENMNPFIHRYEQGQEINEGTAEYVEKRALALMPRVDYKSSLADRTTSLAEEMQSFSITEHLLEDFRTRITDSSISPEDVPRNRIYPVGSTQGLLADYLGIEWKPSAQRAGTGFSFVQLFKEKLGLRDSDPHTYLDSAKAALDYAKILASTAALIAEYEQGFEQALAAFENQTGYRIEITLRPSGLWRSRSSADKKWLSDRGRLELRSHFTIYSLTGDDFLLQIRETGVLEENDWDDHTRSIVFFVPEIGALAIDSVAWKGPAGEPRQFRTLEITSDNLELKTSRAGTLLRDGRNLRVHLIP